MKLISIFFLFQLAQSRSQISLNELLDQISHEELLNIRENYCQSVKSRSKNADLCQTAEDDLPDWITPGILLYLLSIVREANELCEIYYEEFHGIKDFSLVNNTYIAAGGQGMVFKCECFQEGIQPSITAQKGKNWLNQCS